MLLDKPSTIRNKIIITNKFNEINAVIFLILANIVIPVSVGYMQDVRDDDKRSLLLITEFYQKFVSTTTFYKTENKEQLYFKKYR
jgi:hypothetical protein